MRRLLPLLVVVLLALSAAPSAAQPPPCRDHRCLPGPVGMGRLLTTGAETGDATTEGVGLASGTAAATISTSNPRSGARHFRGGPTIVPAFVRYTITPTVNVTYFFRAYVYIPTNPSTGSIVSLIKVSSPAAILQQSLRLTATGSTIGDTTTVPMTYGAWIRLEMSMVWNGTAATYAARADGTTIGLFSSATNAAPGFIDVGWATGPSTSTAIDIDDIALNDDQGASQNTWPGDGKEVLLLPVTDSATGTGWTLGTGTAPGTAVHTAVANTPPLGVADLAVGSDVKQVRNASANANVNVDQNMTTYTAAGIVAADTINLLDPIVATGAPVVTSAKAGTVGVVSNPAITNVALGAGGTAGAFWSGVAAGTYPTGWKVSHGTLTYAPSVTVGTAPVMRVTQVTSSTRIAIVSFMGIYVDYTPAVADFVPYSSPYPQILVQ